MASARRWRRDDGERGWRQYKVLANIPPPPPLAQPLHCHAHALLFLFLSVFLVVRCPRNVLRTKIYLKRFTQRDLPAITSFSTTAGLGRRERTKSSEDPFLPSLVLPSNQTKVQFTKVSNFGEVGIPWLCTSSAQNPVKIIIGRLLFDYKPRCGPYTWRTSDVLNQSPTGF